MTHALKHMAIRIWLTVLLGGIFALVGLPAAQKPMGLEWAFVLALPIFAAMFVIVGWGFNRVGRLIVKRLVAEADVWERAGNTRQAEKLLRKAVSVCDSFLISPFKKARRTRGLTGHMSRFYLTQSDSGPRAQDIIQTYLKISPKDQAVAEAWLQHLTQQDSYRKEHEGLLYRIERAHPEHAEIQAAIARYYLSAGRADFQALQTYRRLLESNHDVDKIMMTRLADLLLHHKRTEAWALKVYLAAYRISPKQHRLLPGVAACLHWAPAVKSQSPLYKKARALLARFDEAALEKMSLAFRPLEQPLEKPAPKESRLRVIGTVLLKAVQAAAKSLAALPPRMGSALTATSRRIRSYPKFKPLLRWTVVGFVGIGLAVLVANTARHLLQSRQTPQDVEAPPVVEITDPFTLQVAAYLKTEHAEKYVQHLKQQGLDAYWTVAQDAKRKWYQVRVSHFADKDSARAYGDTLKSKGIIDDFYVANYERP